MSRLYTYIAGDWTGDSDAIEQLHKWNKSKYCGLSFRDAHDLTQSRDDSLNCSIKASLRYRLDESHTFVLVVGKDTMTRRAGSCQHCFEANKCGNQTHKSYIECECDKAANDGLKIIVLYNSTRIYRDRCPEVLRWKGTHVAMKTWNSLYGLTDWDYYAVKSAFECG